MWKLFGSRDSHAEGISCVSCTRDGVAVAHVMPGTENFGIKTCEFLPCDDESKQAEMLRKYVVSHHLEGADCVYVLQPHEYRLILIDAPSVPLAELKDAARWAVMDFVDFPIDDAGIDTFKVPIPEGQKQKLYVIITRKSLLQRISKLVSQASLILSKIDIAELTLCHAMGLLHIDNEGLALLFSSDDGEHLLIEKESKLYFERRFERVQSTVQAEQSVGASSSDSIKVSDDISPVQQEMQKKPLIPRHTDRRVHETSLAAGNEHRRSTEKSTSAATIGATTNWHPAQPSVDEEYLIIDTDSLESKPFQFTEIKDKETTDKRTEERFNEPKEAASSASGQSHFDEQRQKATGFEKNEQTELLSEKIATKRLDEKIHHSQHAREEGKSIENTAEETDKASEKNNEGDIK